MPLSALSDAAIVLCQWQRAPKQQSRAAAGDAHRRLHMTCGPRKFSLDSKEVQLVVIVVNLMQLISVCMYCIHIDIE